MRRRKYRNCKALGNKCKKITVLVYSICGLMAAMAGIMMSARLGSAQPSVGEGYELNIIAACIIGGTSTFGGRGTILGTAIKEAYYGAFAKNPGGYKEMIVIDTQSDQLKATADYQAALAAMPDINVAINVCGFGAPAAQKAVAEAGMNGKVYIMAIDDIQETMDGIKNGTIHATMTQNFYRMGYEPVVWINNFVTKGVKPAKVVNDSGTLVVTKDNMDSYKQDMRNPSAW